MNIPPRADKWIAFTVTLGLAELDYSRASDLQTVPLEWLLVAEVLAVLFVIWFGLWSALVWILAHPHRARASWLPPRIVSNARFVVFLALAYLLAHTPLYTTEARINFESAVQPTQDTATHQRSE